MIVREEAPSDIAVVRGIVCAAFGSDAEGAEPVEAVLLDQLRSDTGWIPQLSLVATVEDDVVGHAVCTRGTLGALRCVGLGPISVLPELQTQGIGSALMHTMIGTATGIGEPLIALLGDPGYYSQFGFAASSQFDISPPDASWGEFFQVRLLSLPNEPFGGTFEYAEPFGRL